MMEVKPVTLEGKRVRLEPMRSDHLDGLAEAGAFEELWKWTRTFAHTPESMKEYVDEALSESANGAALPFVTIDKETGKVIGSTRFANFDAANRHVEIGWTWITPSYQRTYVNSEAKYLMLTHAFEVWMCARVELKTDVLNSKSRNAMLRMGATEEGALRKHVLAFNGRWRDTIYYSVLDTEWPEVKARLRGFMEREG
ncbi:MAG TPA: GNAT family protein [Gemmatimonadaceae bacterium]|nr:GNAT family protein [Gemmatimonadaceae bacterium]